MIKIKNLTKYYGKFKSLDKVNLTVKKGIIFGFIGPNGAGKSTTIKCLMNILNYEGEIYIDNKLITKEDIKYKRNIGYLPSDLEVYEDMRTLEFIKYNSTFYDFDTMTKAMELVNELKLDLTKRVSELSFGNLKKLGIVIALMHDPNILILDEPTTGLDPLMQEVFYQILRKSKEEGKTIFFSSHNLKEVSGLCDDVAIIKEGKIIKIDNISELIGKKIVTITGNYDKIRKKINKEIIEENKNSVKFVYSGKLNKLLKLIEETQFEDLLIENSELEEVFLTYYKEEK
ncbi:MAG: ATP-binding cassette domain-containing protein [Mollicutes bacterium]|jgi:ABC-2 type transport system ATP-binding protein|nr:ATP-binding cassette domain-containing protein [Mollicutes bacterium]